MNRREALTTMGAAAVCPTAAMAIPEKKDKNLFSDWTDGQIEALEWALECFFEHVGKMPNFYSKNIDYVDAELLIELERRFKEKIDKKLSELHRFGVA